MGSILLRFTLSMNISPSYLYNLINNFANVDLPFPDIPVIPIILSFVSNSKLKLFKIYLSVFLYLYFTFLNNIEL